MKIEVEVVFVSILIILNLTIGGFFIFVINDIKSPDIYAEIEILDVTKDEIEFQVKMEISNSNIFDLIVKDVQIKIRRNNGDLFTELSFDGGKVKSHDEKTFFVNKKINFEGDIPQEFTSELKAKAGVLFLGLIKKEIPIKSTIKLSVEKLIDKIEIPNITIEAGFDEIVEDGLKFKSDIIMNNPNEIELSIEDINLDIITDDEKTVGEISIEDGILKAKDELNLKAEGLLKFEALDSEKLFIDLKTKASIYVAGIIQSINLSANANLIVPNLQDLLNLKNESMDFTIAGEFKLRFRGVLTNIKFSVYNPSNIPLEAKNLVCKIYGATGEDLKIIAENEMESCLIESKQKVCVGTDLVMPYLKILTSGTKRIIPEWFYLKIEGDFSIENTEQNIPISINGYVDPHLFI